MRGTGPKGNEEHEPWFQVENYMWGWGINKEEKVWSLWLTDITTRGKMAMSVREIEEFSRMQQENCYNSLVPWWDFPSQDSYKVEISFPSYASCSSLAFLTVVLYEPIFSMLQPTAVLDEAPLWFIWVTYKKCASHHPLQKNSKYVLFPFHCKLSLF